MPEPLLSAQGSAPQLTRALRTDSRSAPGAEAPIVADSPAAKALSQFGLLLKRKLSLLESLLGGHSRGKKAEPPASFSARLAEGKAAQRRPAASPPAQPASPGKALHPLSEATAETRQTSASFRLGERKSKRPEPAARRTLAAGTEGGMLASLAGIPPRKRAEEAAKAGPAAGTAASAAAKVGQRPGQAKARVVVVDLRRRQHPANQAAAWRPSAANEATLAAPKRPAQAETILEQAGKEFTAAFRSPGFDRLSARTERPQPAERSPALFRAFQERLIPEIVHRTGIILRDGNQGEIRLVLKPEKLGSMRIRLRLRESSLEGRIIVDNNSVKELLEANLDHLKSALRQEGFPAANIEVSVGGGRSGGETPAGAELYGEPVQAAERTSIEEFDRAVPLLLEPGFEYATINLIV